MTSKFLFKNLRIKEITANGLQNAYSDDFGYNFVSKLRSSRREIAAQNSEFILDLLRLMSTSLWYYVIGSGPGNCMCIVHCIASHCAKCRTFLFETKNDKDVP